MFHCELDCFWVRPGGPGRKDPPIIDPHYLETDYDRLTLRKALKIARLIGHHAELNHWRGHEVLPGDSLSSDANLDSFLARSASTHHHPAGTCRMGRDDGAVVDETLGVRGFDNLFAADASVMSSLTSGPINAAVMAIAETWCAMFPVLR